jgi:hypothetical protein
MWRYKDIGGKKHQKELSHERVHNLSLDLKNTGIPGDNLE